MLLVSAPNTPKRRSVRFGERDPFSRMTRYVAPRSTFQTTFDAADAAGRVEAGCRAALPPPPAQPAATTITARKTLALRASIAAQRYGLLSTVSGAKGQGSLT